MRQLYDEANRWTAVEDELRAMLSGVAGANLIRRQRIALIAGQAFNIGAQLARDPAHAVLVPHVQEVKRLKSFKRRKKAAPAPGTPPPPAPHAAGEPSESRRNVMGGRETGRVQARPVVSSRPSRRTDMRTKRSRNPHTKNAGGASCGCSTAWPAKRSSTLGSAPA